jgi:hypothetical protein
MFLQMLVFDEYIGHENVGVFLTSSSLFPHKITLKDITDKWH